MPDAARSTSEAQQPAAAGACAGSEDLGSADRTGRALSESLVVALLAAAVLVAVSVSIDLRTFHYGGTDGAHLNDQVSYVVTARNLAETGRLHSNVIYPSVLHQNARKDYFYMPGHYYALAASYVMFGYGVLQSFLPSLLSFVLAAVLVFLTARKLYGRAAAFAAAAVFVLFPPNIIYAFTAMAELPLVCATAFTLVAVVHWPERSRPYIAPLLIGVPFLFRETAVILAIPVALHVAFGGEKRSMRLGVVSLAIGVAICLALSASIGAGRPSLLLANIFDPTFQTTYIDAEAQRAISPAWSDWLSAPARNVWRNAGDMAASAAGLAFDAWLALAIVAAASLALAMRRRKIDSFALSAPIQALLVLFATLAVYSPHGYRALRMLLFAWPLAAIALSPLASRALAVSKAGGRARGGLALAAGSALGLCTASVMLQSYAALDAIERNKARLMERLEHDDTKVLITPGHGPLDYILAHHPVRWGFLPANPETFKLMADKYDIGTILVTDGQHRAFGPGIFEQYGLTVEHVVPRDGDNLLVFKCQRPRCSGAPLDPE
jgi:hypothetical protein